MEQLAYNSHGSYAYADDLDEAQKFFVEDPTFILEVIDLDTTPAPPAERCREIQVDFNPDVVAHYRLITPIRPDPATSPMASASMPTGLP